MKINIKATNLTLDQPLEVYIEEKIGGLTKFIEKFDATGVAEAWVEIGKTTRHHNTGPVWRAECDIRLPNFIARAEACHKDLRQAIDLVKDEMEKQIKSYKEGRWAKVLRGARHAKRLYKETDLLPKEKKGERVRDE
jgi:ribosomal subunit interface protein